MPNQDPEFEPMAEKEIHLRDYLKVIRKRKYTLFTVFVIINAIVILTTFSATPLYQAAAKLLIEKNEANPLSNFGYMAFDPEFLETQAQIIKSSSVGRKVVKLLDLENTWDTYFPQNDGRFSPVEGLVGWVAGLGGLVDKLFSSAKEPAAVGDSAGGAEPVSREDQLAMMIGGGIGVTPVRDSRIVTVGYTSPNPELAKKVVNAVSKAYIEKILDMRMQSSGYTIEWMTQKADQERTKLETSEEALQRYMQDNDIVTIEDRVAITPQKLSELGTQFTKAEAQRNELEALYQKVSRANANPVEASTIPVVAQNPAVQALRTKIIASEQSCSELAKKFGPKHPVMKRALAELESLKTKLNEEIGHVVKTVKNEFELARSNEENVAELLATTKNSAIHLSEKSVQYGILKRDVETNRKIYDALVSRIKEQGVTEQIQTINVWVVEEASAPLAPSKPNKKRNLMLGLMLGLMGGVGLCFFIEYFDNTIKSADDVQERFGLPVLGLVLHHKINQVPIEKTVLEDSSSALAESYRTLRTAVMLLSAGQPPKSLLVTSMSPGEGKTTTAINLALALAQTDLRVLLVDADLRRPRIHKVFGLDNARGLTTLLAGASEEKVIHKGPLPNLSIISAGPVPPNPSELLISRRFEVLLKAVGQKYDMVIFDSAPIMTVTDSLILSRILEGTIVVAWSGKTTYELLFSGLTKLKEVKAAVLGMVVNGAKASQGHYYNYYNYQYYGEHPDRKSPNPPASPGAAGDA